MAELYNPILPIYKQLHRGSSLGTLPTYIYKGNWTPWPRLNRPKWPLFKPAPAAFVIQSPITGSFMCYHSYESALKKYCKAAGVTEISTHGLRHSTSELYQAHGASRDDLRILFGHSSLQITDRYIHDKGQRLAKVANQIRLFDDGVSQNISQIDLNAKVIRLNDFRQNQKEVSNL